MKNKLLERADLAPAASHFANACRASRLWSHKLNILRDRYGVPTLAPHVSGCGVEEATDAEKDDMRALAETVSRESAAGYAARPPRVHESTMRALASAVARQVGSGWYGPQP